MKAYNKDNPIYEEYSLKEILEWLCNNAREKGKKANLRRSDFSKSDLRGSDLRGSDLSESDFSKSDLRGSNLRGSDFRWSDLSESDFRGSDLRGSDLSYVDLSYADLSGSDFDFSVLNLSCKGINLRFDERVIKQLMNHALKQDNHCEMYEEIKQAFLDNPKWIDWLESWHREDEVKHLKNFIK
jgi:uncharacterized protein YjbI with pentapeptide repeats